jgi:hypothetical protein
VKQKEVRYLANLEKLKKFGFIEVNQTPVYVKILKPRKILEAALADLLQKNHGLKTALQKLEIDICLCVRGEQIRLNEMLHGTSWREKTVVQAYISLSEKSLSALVNFRNMSRFQKLLNLSNLMLWGKIRIRVCSIAALPRIVRATLDLMKVL